MREQVFGVLGLFQSDKELLEAIPKVKDDGFTSLEAYTPYPVHGLDEALGLGKSKVGVLVFIMALVGALSALAFEWWTSTVSYPLHMAGKPYNGWQGWIPVAFEATILFGTFTAGLGTLFVFNKLPFFGDPVLGSKAGLDISRDRFALVILPLDGELDTSAAAAALAAAGGEAIESIPMPSHPKVGFGWWAKTVAGIAAACVVAGGGVSWAERTVPTVKPYVEMADQPRLGPEAADRFFVSGRGMQRPPVGTVARAYMPIVATTPEEGGKALVDPLPVTAEVLARGRRMFNVHCAVCHDKLGTGNAWLDKKYTAKPANLHSSTMRNASDGLLYWVISKGYNTMPGYAADISQDDRWAIVRYVRALQRSQDAPARDELAARSRSAKPLQRFASSHDNSTTSLHTN
jgi:mono/diheme cytochrome c family protein